MLLINSMIRTVLPTPAPPKRPILPPFVYGARRSITLMPVSRISVSVDCSAKSGASWWIARRASDLTGPCSSTGSPVTFRIRPNVALPTGTVIGSPLLTTGVPRTRPSVASIAMARTVFSPRCWATSRVSALPLLSVSRAFKISGRSPSNCTSTTAPITWVILPVAVAIVSILQSS